MEGREFARCSVLITRAEFVACRLMQQRRMNGGRAAAERIGALLLIVGGVAGIVLGGQRGLSPWLTGGVLALGVMWLLLQAVFWPMLLRARAAGEYEQYPENRQAEQFVFYEDGVQVHTSREEGVVPWSALTGWLDDETFLVLYFGRELTIVLPRRVLDATQEQALIAQLRAL